MVSGTRRGSPRLTVLDQGPAGMESSLQLPASFWAWTSVLVALATERKGGGIIKTECLMV